MPGKRRAAKASIAACFPSRAKWVCAAKPLRFEKQSCRLFDSLGPSDLHQQRASRPVQLVGPTEREKQSSRAVEKLMLVAACQNPPQQADENEESNRQENPEQHVRGVELLLLLAESGTHIVK